MIFGIEKVGEVVFEVSRLRGEPERGLWGQKEAVPGVVPTARSHRAGSGASPARKI
jgi:hypothetical protein